MSIRAVRAVASAFAPLLLTGCCCAAGPRCGPPPCAAPAALPPPPAPVAVAPGAREPVPAPAAEGPQVLIEATWLRVPERLADEVLSELEPKKKKAPRPMTKADADALAKRLQAWPGVVVLAMPSIVTVSGQTATVAVGETAAPAPGEKAPAWTGLRMKAVPRVSADRRYVTLELGGEWRPTDAAHTGPRIKTHATVPSGGAVLVASDRVTKAKEGRTTVLVIVTATVIPAR